MSDWLDYARLSSSRTPGRKIDSVNGHADLAVAHFPCCQLAGQRWVRPWVSRVTMSRVSGAKLQPIPKTRRSTQYDRMAPLLLPRQSAAMQTDVDRQCVAMSSYVPST